MTAGLAIYDTMQVCLATAPAGGYANRGFVVIRQKRLMPGSPWIYYALQHHLLTTNASAMIYAPVVIRTHHMC